MGEVSIEPIPPVEKCFIAQSSRVWIAELTEGPVDGQKVAVIGFTGWRGTSNRAEEQPVLMRLEDFQALVYDATAILDRAGL